MFFTGKDSNFDSYSHLTHSSLPKDPDGDERKLGRCLKANLGWLRDPFLSFYPAEGLSDYSAPYSVRFSHSDLSDSLQPHGVQHARLPCPSPTPGVHSDSCALSRWCHSAISSSVVPFSSCPQSLPASESFPMSQLFEWGSQSIGVSASASVLPMEHPGLIAFRMDWLDLLAVQGTRKRLLQHHSSKSSFLRPSAFFTVQLSHPYMTPGKTTALTRQTFVGKVMYLLWICYLGWS